MKVLDIDEKNDSGRTLYRGTGCDACLNISYRGREGVYEMLEINHRIRNMIVEEVSDDQMKDWAIKEGMKTLKKQGISQVLRGTTTLKELTRVVDMREE